MPDLRVSQESVQFRRRVMTVRQISRVGKPACPIITASSPQLIIGQPRGPDQKVSTLRRNESSAGLEPLVPRRNKTPAGPRGLSPRFGKVHPEGVEPPTYGSEVHCSIQLSYGCILSENASEHCTSDVSEDQSGFQCSSPAIPCFFGCS